MDKRLMTMFVALAGAICCLIPIPAEAQAELSGIDATWLYVGPLDDEAKSCGARADALDGAMRIPISSTPLKVRKEEFVSGWEGFSARLTGPTLRVELLALRMPSGLCVISIHTSFARLVYFSPEDLKFRGQATVWSTYSVITGLPLGLEKRLVDEVESHTKRFLGTWLKSN